jgi:hypothetical protein
MKNEGYVVFVNENKKYLDLLEILIESVINFSTKSIEVFSINFDYKHSSDRVISRRVDVPVVNFENICYTKLYSSFNSSFDYGIQLDSDFIITKEMDKLFNDCHKIIKYPLGSRHPQDPDNQSQIMSYLGVKEKSQPYVHATYLFSKESKPFLEECYNLSKELQSKGIIPPNYDETILNCMLWKNNVNDFVTTYDPYFDFFIHRDRNHEHGYGTLPINFYSCHAQKDPIEARKILNKLINGEI